MLDIVRLTDRYMHIVKEMERYIQTKIYRLIEKPRDRKIDRQTDR